jgi:hypothetical protein
VETDPNFLRRHWSSGKIVTRCFLADSIYLSSIYSIEDCSKLIKHFCLFDVRSGFGGLGRSRKSHLIWHISPGIILLFDRRATILSSRLAHDAWPARAVTAMQQRIADLPIFVLDCCESRSQKQAQLKVGAFEPQPAFTKISAGARPSLIP